MNKEVKQKWVDALLSGRYEKGEGYLLRDGKYCALGVLCDLMSIPFIEADCNGPTIYEARFPNGQESTTLEESYALSIGLTLEEVERIAEENDTNDHDWLHMAMFIDDEIDDEWDTANEQQS